MDKEIFTKIWFQPRKVFKYINSNQYNSYMYILVMLAGISSTFHRAVEKHVGDQLPFFTVAAMVILIGALLSGVIGYYIYSALVAWTGKLLNGKSNTRTIFNIFAYANIPLSTSLFLLIPLFFIFGNDIFKSNAYDDIYSRVTSYSILGIYILETILSLYTIVLMIIALSEVQKFSIIKSILNHILAILTFLIPTIVIAFLFMKK